ncbi:RND transporter [Bryobacterales bacterium F-183]|nr:RND transporter [Bryobacterales bacterium F-183]
MPLALVCTVATAAVLAAGVRYEELAAEALQKNPSLLAAQKAVQAAKLRPSQVSSLPDPMVSVASNSVKYPVPGAGLGREVIANIGVMASQTMPAPGKLKLRGDLAYKEAEVELAEFRAVEIEVLSRLKQAYVRLGYTQAARRVLVKNRELLNQLLRVTEARYTVGKAAQQDLFKAQTQLSLLEARLLRLEQEGRAAQAEIGSLVARTFADEAADEPRFVAFTDTIDELARAADEYSPVLAKARKTVQKTEVAVNLARKDYYPDYTLSAGYFNMGTMAPMYMLRADVTVPLFYARKQRPAVAEAVETSRMSRRTYEAADQAVRLTIQDEFLAASTASKLLALYSNTVIPQAGLALESSLASYETGAVDFLSVLTNFNAVLEFEVNYAEELRNLHVAMVRIDAATGRLQRP